MKRAIGYGWLLCGILCLINPYLNLLDFFPDFLGYLFLLKGLREVVWAEPYFTDMRKTMLQLLAVSAARAVMFPMVASMPQDESPTMSLLCVFCLTCVELFFGIRCLQELQGGMRHISMDDRMQPVSKGFPRKRLWFFFLAKLIGNLLPEMCVLGIVEDGYIDSVTDNMSQRFLQLRNVLAILFFFLVGICSLMLLIGFLKWVRNLRKCQTANEALAELCDAHPEPTAHRTLRLTRSAVLFFSTAVFLSWSLRIDGIVLIPTAFGALAMYLGLRLFSRILPSAEAQKKHWLVLAVLSAGNYLSQLLFYMQYCASGVAKGRGDVWFGLNILAALLCGIGFALAFARMAKSLSLFVDRYGFAPVDPALIHEAREQENKRLALHGRLRIWALTAFLPAVCEGVEAALLFTSFGPTPEQAFPIWGVFTTIRLAWIVFSCILFSQINDTVREQPNEFLASR